MYDEGIHTEDYSGVLVPECSFSLSEENTAHLQLTVDPLSESDNYGIELYENTLDLL